MNRRVATRTSDGVEVVSVDHDFRPQLEFYWSKHCAHWKVLDRGHASLEFAGHKTAGHLSIDANEWTEIGTGKRTMLTLGREEVVMLHKFLGDILETSKAKA